MTAPSHPSASATRYRTSPTTQTLARANKEALPSGLSPTGLPTAIQSCLRAQCSDSEWAAHGPKASDKSVGVRHRSHLTSHFIRTPATVVPAVQRKDLPPCGDLAIANAAGPHQRQFVCRTRKRPPLPLHILLTCGYPDRPPATPR